MRFIDIAVFHIGQTQVNEKQILLWMDHLGTSSEFRDELETILLNDDEEGRSPISDPALLIALAAKRCYMSFEPGLNPNVTKVRKDWTEYLDNVLSQKHGSVLEHSVHNFAFEGISRVFTGEMNRHRAGVAISEGSMRYIRHRDIPMWLPTSLRLTDEERLGYEEMQPWISSRSAEDLEDEPAYAAYQRALKKLKSQAVFKAHAEMTERNYAELQEIWKDELAESSKFKGKKQITSMMRRIIPMGVATGGVWSLNIRALRHIMALRASPAAEEEILEVWSRAGKIMVESEPSLLGDFSQTPEGYWIPKYEKV